MPIFISHSHQDKDFVDALATNLIRRRENVWVDRWELRVGDSLINRIQSAITTASSLVIVLSKSSVASEWCKKELNAGLIRELEERRVIVLPLLLEDCDIPLFLKDKKYADFRKDFDAGLSDIQKAVVSISSDTQGRIEKPDFHVDWGVAWGEDDGKYVVHLRFISHGEKIPYCVFTQVMIICNKELTQRFHKYRKQGMEWFGRLFVIKLFYSGIKNEGNTHFIIRDSIDVKREMHFLSTGDDSYGFDAYISAVRLGVDTDMNTWVEWGVHIKQVLEDLEKEVSPADRDKLQKEFARGLGTM